MMRKLPGHLLCCALIFGATASTSVNAQSYGGSQLPPIIVSGQLDTADASTRVLPPIITPERALPKTTSSMLQPLQPNGDGVYLDKAVKQAQSAMDKAKNAVSSAGIPLYQSKVDATSGQESLMQQWKVGQSASFPESVSTPPKPTAMTVGAIQGSGSRNVLPPFSSGGLQGSGARDIIPQVQSGGFQGSGNRSVVPPFSGGPVDSFAPGNFQQDFSSTPTTVIDPNQPVFQGQTVFDGSFQGPGGNNFFDQSGQAFQSSCGGPTSNTGCSSCGPGGCYDPSTVQSQFASSGSVASADNYFWGDFLYWTRANGDIQGSTFFGLNDFSFEGGFRGTLGFRQNATRGRELTYFGTGDIEESATVNNAAGALGNFFIPTGGLNAGNISAFTNATSQTQTKESKLHSLEFNRVNWGWDVLKTYVGARFIYFQDDFEFLSSNAGGSGAFAQNSVNNLFGGHVGGELFYDVGYRSSVSFTGKAGAYLNLASFDTELENVGTTIIDRDIEEAHLASSLELGVLGHYQLSTRARFRLGYDLVFLWGLFAVDNNFPRPDPTGLINPPPNFLSPLTGTDPETNNDVVLFHGFSFGLEIFR